MKFVRIDDDLFIRGNKRHWQTMVSGDPTKFTEMLGGRWLLLDPRDEDFATLMTIGDRNKFILANVPSNGRWWRGEPKTIHVSAASLSEATVRARCMSTRSHCGPSE